MPTTVKCVGRGTGTVDEVGYYVDPSTVQFLICRFPLGSGTFKRTKWIHVIFSGPDCGAVKRGRFSARREEVEKAIGPVQASVEITQPENVTFEYIASQVRGVFKADDGKFDAAALKKEYEANVAAAAEVSAVATSAHSAGAADGPKAASSPHGGAASGLRAAAAGGSAGSPKKSKSASEVQTIIATIRQTSGPTNWAMFEGCKAGAEPTLVSSGGGGLPELLEYLPEDQMVWCVVRIAFGTGRWKRSKCVLMRWAGPSMGQVTKGRAMAMDGPTSTSLGRFSASIGLAPVDMSEATMGTVLDHVRPVFVVDDLPDDGPTVGGGKKKAEALSEEAYLEALAEEQGEAYEGGDEAAEGEYAEGEYAEGEYAEGEYAEGEYDESWQPTKEDFDVDESVYWLHDDEGSLSWAIFEIEL